MEKLQSSTHLDTDSSLSNEFFCSSQAQILTRYTLITMSQVAPQLVTCDTYEASWCIFNFL
jgi:hypothetical protein